MVHVLASIGFTLVALATLSFIVLMLAASREAILAALGVGQTASVSYAAPSGPGQDGGSLAGHADGFGAATARCRLIFA